MGKGIMVYPQFIQRQPPPPHLLSFNNPSHCHSLFGLGLTTRKCNVESRNQGLSEPEREDELGTSHEELGNETLEEGRGALILGHVSQDAEAALGVLKVAVLNAGLDDVEWCRHDQRRGSTRDGGNKVLEPGGLVVVLEAEKELLGECGTTEEL